MRYFQLMLALGLLAGCTSDPRPLGLLPPSAATTAPGLAAQYPNDQDIDRDPAVVFAENFDRPRMEDLLIRFTDLKQPENVSLVEDGPRWKPGRRALRITSVGGSSTGGGLYKKLPKSYDWLYLRYYIKYPAGGRFTHSSGWFGGYAPPSDWPQPHAGIRPNGTERFSIAAEPVNDSDQLDFYTYWMGMRGGPSGDWGNWLINDPSLVIQRDRWTCIEIMAKLNQPVAASNGELALWMDGKLVSHLQRGSPVGTWAGGIFTPNSGGEPFEGFQWRSDPALALNWLWLLHYSTKDPPGYVGSLFFDHVVLATSRVGCLSE